MTEADLWSYKDDSSFISQGIPGLPLITLPRLRSRQYYYNYRLEQNTIPQMYSDLKKE